MRIAVLSDIHAAAGALASALAAARAEGFDQLVILGDLLTYGPSPERTLELISNVLTGPNVVLIEGNHDRMYRSVAAKHAYLPAGSWIRESVDWTLERIDVDEFSELAWRTEYQLDGTLFAHANPYPFGDWAYLRSDDDFREAIATLIHRGLKHGVFGHSHRHCRFDRGSRTAITVGSIGQPRTTGRKVPIWTLIELGKDHLAVASHGIDYDWRDHCESIRATNMSDQTKDRLCEFFL